MSGYHHILCSAILLVFTTLSVTARFYKKYNILKPQSLSEINQDLFHSNSINENPTLLENTPLSRSEEGTI